MVHHAYYHILYALKWGILTIFNTLLNCISLLAFNSFIQPLLKKIITPSHIHRHTQINIFKHCFESLYNYTTLAVLAQIQHASLIKLFINFLLTSPSTTKHRLRRRVAGPARLLRSGFWQSFFNLIILNLFIVKKCKLYNATSRNNISMRSKTAIYISGSKIYHKYILPPFLLFIPFYISDMHVVFLLFWEVIIIP